MMAHVSRVKSARRDVPKTSSGFLPANSVVAVVPPFVVIMPNPRSRDDGPEHWDGGVHYVWPFKLGSKIPLTIILLRMNKAAKEHY